MPCASHQWISAVWTLPSSKRILASPSFFANDPAHTSSSTGEARECRCRPQLLASKPPFADAAVASQRYLDGVKMRVLDGLGLDRKTIQQVLIVVLWVAAGLVATISILLLPRPLGFVGAGWNKVVEQAAQPAALVFTIAGVLFVGGRRRAAFGVAGTALALLLGLVVFAIRSVR
jgi:hypothetical protein